MTRQAEKHRRRDLKAAATGEQEYPVPLMCAFALGRGKYCTGDVTKPGTHAPECPAYVKLGTLVD